MKFKFLNKNPKIEYFAAPKLCRPKQLLRLLVPKYGPGLGAKFSHI